jgi:hypothetical protein
VLHFRADQVQSFERLADIVLHGVARRWVSAADPALNVGSLRQFAQAIWDRWSIPACDRRPS